MITLVPSYISDQDGSLFLGEGRFACSGNCQLSSPSPSSVYVCIPYWRGLDNLTGSSGPQSCIVLHCQAWYGFYGWMPSLVPSNFQCVLGAFCMPTVLERLISNLQGKKRTIPYGQVEVSIHEGKR